MSTTRRASACYRPLRNTFSTRKTGIRFTKAVANLPQASALCAAHDGAILIRCDRTFFQAVGATPEKPAALAEYGRPGRRIENCCVARPGNTRQYCYS